MYLEYYNLKEKPFSLTPDPAFLYYSNVHKRAISFLRYGLQESKGFLQLTGPVGSGKTTLLRAVLAQLGEKTKTAYIINPCASFPELLRAVMKDLEIRNIPQTSSKMELLDFFHEYLLVQARRSCPVVVIFDEAQNLSLRNLEEIRMLSNFETAKQKLLQIIFVGQPELVRVLDLPELRQLKQRIQVRYHLSPLPPREVREYINHRLTVAGSDGRIHFTDEACDEVFSFSGGIPRLINAICDVVLLIGYVSEQTTFGTEAVADAAKELDGRFEDSQAEANAQPVPPPGNEDLRGEAPVVVPAAEDAPADPAADSVQQAGVPRGREPEPVSKMLEASDPEEEAIPARTFSHTVGGGIQRSLPGAPVRTQGSVAALDTFPQSDFQPSEDRMNGMPLNSFLRHRTTKKFRTIRTGLVRLDGTGDVRERLKHFMSKCISAKASTTGARRRRPAATASEHTAVRELRPGTPCARRARAVQEAVSAPAVIDCAHPAAGGDCEAAKAQHKPGTIRLMNGKIIIIFKNGSLARGIIQELPLSGEGFSFFPIPESEPDKKRYAAFEHIVAVHIVSSFNTKVSKRRPAPGSVPKGRQIIIALMNGDLLEATLPKLQSLADARLFVIYPGGKQTSWALVEKSATVGILTETMSEGIYAEQFEPLTSCSLLDVNDDLAVTSRETAGDALFSSDRFGQALRKYWRLWRDYPDSKRLLVKVSLSYFNLGIQLVRLNRHAEAMEAFTRVNSDNHLRARALRVSEDIKIFVR